MGKEGAFATIVAAVTQTAICLVVLMAARPVGADEYAQYTIRLGSHPVFETAFAHDGRTFAATQLDRITLHDAADGKSVRTIISRSPLRTMDRYADWISALAFSPDGEVLAGGRADGSICLWSLRGEDKPVLLKGHNDWVLCLCFSPDGKWLASGGRDNQVLVWDWRKRSVKMSLKGHGSWVECIAFSPDGAQLASGSDDNTVRMWDLNTGQELRKLSAWQGGIITCVTFSADAQSILAGSHKEMVWMWDTKTGRETGRLDGHTAALSGIHVLRGSRLAISSAGDGLLILWDLERKKPLTSVRTSVRSIDSMAVSPDETAVICGRQDGSVQLIRLDRVLKKLKEGNGEHSPSGP